MSFVKTMCPKRVLSEAGCCICYLVAHVDLGKNKKHFFSKHWERDWTQPASDCDALKTAVCERKENICSKGALRTCMSLISQMILECGPRKRSAILFFGCSTASACAAVDVQVDNSFNIWMMKWLLQNVYAPSYHWMSSPSIGSPDVENRSIMEVCQTWSIEISVHPRVSACPTSSFGRRIKSRRPFLSVYSNPFFIWRVTEPHVHICLFGPSLFNIWITPSSHVKSPSSIQLAGKEEIQTCRDVSTFLSRLPNESKSLLIYSVYVSCYIQIGLSFADTMKIMHVYHMKLSMHPQHFSTPNPTGSPDVEKRNPSWKCVSCQAWRNDMQTKHRVLCNSMVKIKVRVMLVVSSICWQSSTPTPHPVVRFIARHVLARILVYVSVPPMFVHARAYSYMCASVCVRVPSPKRGCHEC